MKSYLEATARQRLHHLLDANSWQELLPPSLLTVSPHLAQLNLPTSFDDGVILGRAQLGGQAILCAAQEGGFMGGAVGEVHGAKLQALLRLALTEPVAAVLLLLESGGVRLHEANAGLIAVAEVMQALLEVRNANIPVLILLGGANGCFGGAGILARCANYIIMSENARLAMSGPEVIESVQGVEEFDARDKALVWRTTGGKHRYLIGDCDCLVEDDIAAFRAAAIQAIGQLQQSSLSLDSLLKEQNQLQQRVQDFGDLHEPMEIWRKRGITAPEQIAMLDISTFLTLADGLPSSPEGAAKEVR